MWIAVPAPRILHPGDGEVAQLAGMGARFMIGSEDSDGRFSLVEHPMRPLALGSPLHRHTNEDEYSFVLEGKMGAVLGEDVVYGEPGDLIFKPRGQWHAFWNAIDGPTRILEVISPGGFEGYFEELGEVFAAGPPDPEKIAAVAAKYQLEIQPESIPRLIEEHGLRAPGPPPTD
jgi:mannose-6-phosphate isomerase-like protein (cupin superfamily)